MNKNEWQNDSKKVNEDGKTQSKVEIDSDHPLEVDTQYNREIPEAPEEYEIQENQDQ